MKTKNSRKSIEISNIRQKNREFPKCIVFYDYAFGDLLDKNRKSYGESEVNGAKCRL